MMPTACCSACGAASPLEKIVHIQIHTDQGVELQEGLLIRIRAEVERALGRFSPTLSEVGVHLSGQAGDAGDCNPGRCVLEARIDGRQPIAITRQAETLEAAVIKAAEKLTRVFAHALERAAA